MKQDQRTINILQRQRRALLRAVSRARMFQAEEDVEILISIINLLDELHDALTYPTRSKQ
jgi:hypothetical protein